MKFFKVKFIIFLLIMHYDAITHTRKAIRNLQSQVRLFLRKQNQDILPQINRRSNLKAYGQTPLTLRNSRQKSLFESPVQIESHNSKQHSTISINDYETDHVDVTILKPRSSKKVKIILPKFQRAQRARVQSQSQNHSVQLIQHSLVQQGNGKIDIKLIKQQLQHKKYSLKLKKPNLIPKIPRYNNKARLTLKQQAETIQDMVNLDEANRKQCYSPWEMQQDSELIQMSTIYMHG